MGKDDPDSSLQQSVITILSSLWQTCIRQSTNMGTTNYGLEELEYVAHIRK